MKKFEHKNEELGDEKAEKICKESVFKKMI
jgi:hypothetical protein